MLKQFYSINHNEAGCDEAGRGCLAGPVTAAAVILPEDFDEPMLDDSKKLSQKHRERLRTIIEKSAISFSVVFVENETIDEINILNATYKAMNEAIRTLSVNPSFVLIDGNRFINETHISHQCIVQGDALYKSIAAASILAKTYRDEYMIELHHKYPQYNWKKNKGYPTNEHIAAILAHGKCPYHRISFKTKQQLKLF